MNRTKTIRGLRIGASAVCGILCVLMIALWVRSYRSFDRVSGKIGNGAFPILISYAGSTSCVVAVAHKGWPFPKFDSGPTYATDYPDQVWTEPSLAGFGFTYRTLYINMPNSEEGWHPQGMTGRSWAAGATGILVPHWFLVAVLGAASALCYAGLRWRFSLRTMIVATSLIALAMVLVRDRVQLDRARSEFHWINASWEAGRLVSEEVVAGSRKLMDDEAASVWISHQAAVDGHVGRMKALFEITKARSMTTIGGEDELKRACEMIRDEIRQYEPDQ